MMQTSEDSLSQSIAVLTIDDIEGSRKYEKVHKRIAPSSYDVRLFLVISELMWNCLGNDSEQTCYLGPFKHVYSVWCFDTVQKTVLNAWTLKQLSRRIKIFEMLETMNAFKFFKLLPNECPKYSNI